MRRLGCLGSLIFALLLVVALSALLAPWSFHIGDRWTLMTWQGVGRLRDSAGRQYGLYISFSPELRQGRGTIGGSAMPTPRVSLRGQARVCTAQAMTIPFILRGTIYGAWLDAAGKPISLNLKEQTTQKRKRHFDLHGSFQGPVLVMDDDKSMFMYLLSDDKLTPAPSYTSPVPEKHAQVSLEWGNAADFDHLCRDLPR